MVVSCGRKGEGVEGDHLEGDEHGKGSNLALVAAGGVRVGVSGSEDSLGAPVPGVGGLLFHWDQIATIYHQETLA